MLAHTGHWHVNAFYCRVAREDSDLLSHEREEDTSRGCSRGRLIFFMKGNQPTRTGRQAKPVHFSLDGEIEFKFLRTHGHTARLRGTLNNSSTIIATCSLWGCSSWWGEVVVGTMFVTVFRPLLVRDFVTDVCRFVFKTHIFHPHATA